MKKILLLILLVTFLVSCGSSKNRGTKTIIVSKDGNPNRTRTVQKRESKEEIVITRTEADEVITKESNQEKLENIIDFAKTFEGTRYKFGGTTSNGMDCSGLVYTAFEKENVVMPRISRDMATKGVDVQLSDITEGDLVFFKTSKRHAINHVGIVVEAKPGEILFIHSTTSRGVIISSMDENYWKNAFVKVKRVI
ncbi:C40 family peptidase [Ulvibacter antarcticus]|uniref:NlpC/P60 family protein n=1 Tax=Ulvibacter antarcticus TaxID=442714 RepID=A0A3L9Z4V2_9FLAO|nr:C40 family peptidase [Ulvibacter antarcticus]RMA66489.1 NlpC/P60 family protein [Ulvibacter antarcticus]